MSEWKAARYAPLVSPTHGQIVPRGRPPRTPAGPSPGRAGAPTGSRTDRGDDMSEDALVRRLAEVLFSHVDWSLVAERWIEDPQEMCGSQARAALPIVEDYAKAERKAGAVDALREVQACAELGAFSTIHAEAIRRMIAHGEAS